MVLQMFSVSKFGPQLLNVTHIYRDIRDVYSCTCDVTVFDLNGYANKWYAICFIVYIVRLLFIF